MRYLSIFLTSLILLSSPKICHANVSLPKLVGDNMVLQRDTEIPVWGWAAPGEKINISILKHTYKTKADKDGKWQILLKPIKAGGPYDMIIKGKNTIEIHNILIGDVWLASGQSNMEWALFADVNNYKEEIAQANYPKIRLFTVEKAVASIPLKDVKGSWQECSPETIGSFSAVAYFFGRDLYKEINIPIGLIHSSWGGTPAESWTDINAVKSFPRYAEVAQKLADSPLDINKALEDYNAEMAEWSKTNGKDRGYLENGKTWADPSIEPKGWSTMTLPNVWEQPNILPNYDGVVWFRKELELTEEQTSKPLELHLAMIDDEDITFFNGKKIGKSAGYNALRIYSVPQALIRTGKNSITVRVNDTGGGGGIWGDPNTLFALSGNKKIALSGAWRYNTAYDITDMPKYPLSQEPQYIPTTLYNAMIAPLIPYAIKGTIWYQGESNAWKAYEYGTLFPAMIKGWRQKWGYDFPFIFVQLANFMQDQPQPADYEWAELRDAQTKALQLPKTGMAVAIDIGNPENIHPKNKQDVGKRLELVALKVAYNKDVVYSGPTFESMKNEGDKIRIKFNNIGSGLIVKDQYGYVKGFAIAGPDKHFVWAKGYQDGHDLLLYNEDVEKPEAVRYDWSNNPDGNIYNKEGLPAVPFRTDNYKGITEEK